MRWMRDDTFRIVLMLLGLACLTGARAEALPVTLAVPGPGSLNYLPVELIKKLGADRAEGLDLRLRYFSGGPHAYRDLLAGHSDFAVAGAPALADLAARGEPVVSIATVTRLPAFVLMVRKDLQGRVKDVTDLRGRVIGINSSSDRARSTSQQMAEFVLRRAGVEPEREVNFLAAGQTLEEQQAALESGAVDALMGDEPFASLLREAGRIFYLLDLHDMPTARRLLGGEILYAQLATRRDVLDGQPDKAARMVRALRRCLAWIARATPEEIVARIDPPTAAERRTWLALLRRHKAIFSPDGSFTRGQIDAAEAFFRATAPLHEPGARFDFDRMIDARFVGLRAR